MVGICILWKASLNNWKHWGIDMKKYIELTEQERSQIVGFGVPDLFPEMPLSPINVDRDRNEAIMNIIEEYASELNLSCILHETLHICGYVSKPVANFLFSPLECVLERLEEEYKYEDDKSCTVVTQAMLDAEKAFLDVVITEYVPSIVVPVCCDEISIGGFVKEHCAHWLNGEDEGY